MSVHSLVEASQEDRDRITVETTVLTGFEFTALDECKEKCRPLDIAKAQGRLFFNIPIDQYDKVKALRSVDNVYLVSASVPKLDLQSDKEKDIEMIKGLVDGVDWEKCVGCWSKLVGFDGVLFPAVASGEKGDGGGGGGGGGGGCGDGGGGEEEEVEKRAEGEPIKFRVTCNRVGADHSFTSMEAAAHFGGALQDKFGWTVDLSRYDLEVVLNISSEAAYVCAALTKESLHRRNITHFSSTTLRATMCYNLVRLAEPVTGDVVIDPMCGGGSIPIEGCLGFAGTYYLSGDRDDRAVTRCKCNVDQLRVEGGRRDMLLDMFNWDVTALPIRDQSVDVFVTDLPFGKRSGKKKDNRWLYRSVLNELARVVRTRTGRAVVLTGDKNAFLQALGGTKGDHPYWRKARSFSVNQGGLSAIVCLLIRNSKNFVKF